MQYKKSKTVLFSWVLLVGFLASTINVAFASYFPSPNLTRLLLYWNGDRKDNHSLTRVGTEDNAVSSGYQRASVEGCVFSSPEPGTVPLKLYWNRKRTDNYLLATRGTELNAVGAKYVFVGIEGYVYPPSRC